MRCQSDTFIARAIAGAVFSRLVLNTARRFVYPFAPALSRGLGVSLSAFTALIAINQITGLLGILIGPLADRIGYRKMMIIGMLVTGLGMLAVVAVPVYAVVLIALFGVGLGKSFFDPAIQAWVGSHVAYHRRGLVVGIVEMAWAASTLIGIPLVAVLIERFGWKSPFLLLGALSLIGALGLYRMMPNDSAAPANSGSLTDYREFYTQLAASKPVMGMLGYAFFVNAANDNLFVVYGTWLEAGFGIGIVVLGMATSIIGVAELFGEGLTATLSDRFGLKRSLMVGLTLSCLSYIALPVGRTLPLALTGLFLLFLTYEFTIVTSFSLATELMPASRATMMACLYAAGGCGRVVGALMGSTVWQAGGITATGGVSGALTCLGFICLGLGLRS
ncbi:MAG: MFS transporter [Deltaproteobacteria bacterium]|nr:MAG: MFS transporter [Deltaproteobacteria bacterium]